MIVWLLAALTAHAEPVLPVCSDPAPLSHDTLSVAWIAPAGKRVGASGWLTVTDVAGLRRWANREHADVARLLRGMGLRKSRRPPSRAWVVGIFEIDAADLCRPLADDEAGIRGGLPTCSRGNKGLDVTDDGCGHSVDLGNDGTGLDIFRIQWKVAARRGFCVLPAERFLLGR